MTPILPLECGQGAQVCRRAGHVTDQPRVGHATLGAGRRGGVVRAGAGGVAVIQVRHERVVALRREPASYLLGRRVVARHVVNHHHAAQRALADRPGQVGLDLVPAVTADGDGLGERRVVHRSPFVYGN